MFLLAKCLLAIFELVARQLFGNFQVSYLYFHFVIKILAGEKYVFVGQMFSSNI